MGAAGRASPTTGGRCSRPPTRKSPPARGSRGAPAGGNRRSGRRRRDVSRSESETLPRQLGLRLSLSLPRPITCDPLRQHRYQGRYADVIVASPPHSTGTSRPRSPSPRGSPASWREEGARGPCSPAQRSPSSTETPIVTFIGQIHTAVRAKKKGPPVWDVLHVSRASRKGCRAASLETLSEQHPRDGFIPNVDSEQHFSLPS